MTLHTLKQLNRDLAAALGIDNPLDELLLFLQGHDDYPHYEATPKNCTVFSSMGVDGVHYALLHLPERPFEDSPVIMISPMDSDGWECVGDNLLEFLELHCEECEDYIRQSLAEGKSSEDDLADQRRVIDALRARLSLSPRPDHFRRCEALSALHLPRMEFGPG